jgi:O-antigen/teichoic acid export membrane protein
MFIFNLTGFNRYLANTSWMAAEKIIRLAIAFFISAYVARYLGAERFGILNFVISLVAIFASIAGLGMDDILVRRLVEHPEQASRLLGTGMVLKTGASISCAAATLLLANWFYTLDHTLLAAVLLVGMLFQAFSVIDFYFLSRVQAKYSSGAKLYALVVSSAFKVTLIILEENLFWFAAAFALEQVLAAVILLFLYRKTGGKLQGCHFDRGLAAKLIWDCWPLILTDMAIMLYMRLDQVMIKGILDDASVGYYAAAIRLSESWYFVPMTICSSLFPAIVKARMTDAHVFEEKLQRLYDLLLWMGISAAALTTFFSETIVSLVFGADFLPAAQVLMIHIWAGVFVGIGIPGGKWLLVENLQKYHLLRALIGCLLNIALNLWLIPRYGISGAAWATLVSYGSSAYLSMLLFKQSRKGFWLMTQSFNIFGAYRRFQRF